MILPAREKIFRDPVYGNLSIPYPSLLALVDSPELQRLRRIRQLGMCFTTFHGAEHSRFQHALGVMWLMHRVLERWADRGLLALGPRQRQVATAAALLHDLGHGPFSHALERVWSGVDHEALGRSIVRLRLGPILARYDLDPEEVIGVMEGTCPDPVFSELLSSQLDVDRMDYLQRDSLYTGVKYGLFDIDRIISTLVPLREPGSQRLVAAVDPKGTEAVEEYLFSRYFMHWQVYLHKTVRASEVLLRVILERAREVSSDLGTMPPNLAFLFSPTPPTGEAFLDAFLQIDDFDVFHAIKLWQAAPDPILADLCARFCARRPFKAVAHPGPGPSLDRIREVVATHHGEAWTWYLHEDRPTTSGYGVYRPGSDRVPIRVVDPGRPSQGWREISEVTRTEAVLALSRQVTRPLLLIPPECRAEIEPLLGEAGSGPQR